MPKTDYIARKTKLEAEMNGYNSEIAELETELKANDAITSNNNQLQQYMDQIPELLEFANSTGDTQRKSELLKALGAKVIMYPNGQYKHLTWTLFGGFKRNRQSPLMRLERKQVF